MKRAGYTEDPYAQELDTTDPGLQVEEVQVLGCGERRASNETTSVKKDWVTYGLHCLRIHGLGQFLDVLWKSTLITILFLELCSP